MHLSPHLGISLSGALTGLSNPQWQEKQLRNKAIQMGGICIITVIPGAEVQQCSIPHLRPLPPFLPPPRWPSIRLAMADVPLLLPRRVPCQCEASVHQSCVLYSYSSAAPRSQRSSMSIKHELTCAAPPPAVARLPCPFLAAAAAPPSEATPPSTTTSSPHSANCLDAAGITQATLPRA